MKMNQVQMEQDVVGKWQMEGKMGYNKRLECAKVLHEPYLVLILCTEAKQ